MDGTELELCALGVIWRRGPCSAYVVRTEFVRSRSAYWSGSAGAIYPAVNRLIAAGWIAAAARTGSRRGARDLTITPVGLAALRDWIDRIGPDATTVTYDPVRTRLMFVTALPAGAARADAIARAAAQTRAHRTGLRAHREALLRASDAIEALAVEGALYELDARLRWLRALARTAG